jgi:serine/threonine protein kinase
MSADRWTGRVIDGRYVVESILGQGGMGVVLRARHKFTGAQVALKMLQPDLQVNQDAQDRFLAEAQTPTTIGHPGIVQVLDAGKTPEGELYLAMELLTGRTLRQAMYPSPPPQVTRRILLELLEALGAAHNRGIVHRDLKPENVFLVGPESRVKLLDFGIAKVVQTGRTAAGMMLGTLAYMAPEQLSDASTVDARADLWAVGVMVYELLSGKLPFRGTQLSEIMTALATQEPDPIRVYLPTATPAIEAFLARALMKDRNQRFASAQDMAMGVAAMQLEGTAAPVISTLTGLGPKSNVMTAADSGPGIPSRQPFTAPHVVSSVHPGPVAGPVSAPNFPAQPTPAPMMPGTGPLTAQGPTSPPPPGPSFTPHRAPPGVGSVPMNPPHTPPPGQLWQPPPGSTENLPPKKNSSMDKTSLMVIGGVVVLLIILGIWYTMKSKAVEAGFEACGTTCAQLAKCNTEIDESLCSLKCGLNEKTETCVEQSNGSCETFTKCMSAAGEPLPTGFARDNKWDTEPPPAEPTP